MVYEEPVLFFCKVLKSKWAMAVELGSIYNMAKLLFYIGILSILCGCPRVANLQIYNDTGIILNVESGSGSQSIPPGAY